MNINDVKLEDTGVTGEDMLDQIFARQLELMQKYQHIEEEKGFLIPLEIPFDLHDAKCQYRLKDFAWRITEELGEALESIHLNHAKAHFDEELADALHFLTEFTLLAGMKPRDIMDVSNLDSLSELWDSAMEDMLDFSRTYFHLAFYVGKFVESLGTTCNALKNKPWKQTHMLTDVNYFNKKLKETWVSFAKLALCAGLNHYDMFNLYFKKSEVNKFRQRSNY